VPVLSVLLVFSSCIKEEFNADNIDPTLQINPGIAAPIGWAKYRLDEILTDSLNPDELRIDGDGFISMVYYQDLYSLYASEIVNIPDLLIGKSIQNPLGAMDLNLLTEEYTDSSDFPVPLTFSGTTGARIDSMKLSWGLLTISANTPYPDMIWDARFLFKDVPYWQATIDETNPWVTDTLEDVMIPINPVTNELPLIAYLTIWPSNEVISSGNLLDISISISELDYDVIYGYLGQFDINVGPHSYEVGFYSRLAGGNFTFRDPSLKIHFENSFGLPIQISIEDFHVEGSGGPPIPINTFGTPEIDSMVDYPGPGQEGISVPDSIVLVNSNTDLFSSLSPSYNRINATIEGMSNPPGYDSSNFLLDTSRLIVSSELLLPLNGYADILLVADTLDFVFGDFYENPPEEIKRLLFRLNYRSQFPVKVVSQVVFYDQDMDTLDFLFYDEEDERRIIPGAPVDNNGIAIPFEYTVEVELSRSQIDNISSCYFVVVTGRVTTTDYNPQNPAEVKFYDYYYLHTYIGAIAELEMNSDDY
jgi:hypothetical protein